MFGGGNGFGEAQEKACTIITRVLESLKDSKIRKESIEDMREKGNRMIDKEYP